jgi:6-phosphogluconolactonase
MAQQFVIGTYTKKTSQGIYQVTLDEEQQLLFDANLIIKIGSPTYLAISNNHHLYSVDKQTNHGGVTGFDLNQQPIKQINSLIDPGSSPAYVGIDEQRQLVFTGNYHAGTVCVFKIDKTGSLTKTDEVTHLGLTGPKPEQDAPHVHFTDLTPDKRLVVCDLGMDTTFIYDVSADGKLVMHSRYQSEPGFGSRHIVFHPTLPFAYLLGELSSKIEVLRYHDGAFEHVQTITTIPTDWISHNGAAAIHISADGQFLYASNRGHNSIVVFKTTENGTLEQIQSISSGGDFPRDFAFDTSQRFLICANQNTDNLTLYTRNAKTGLLTTIQKDFNVPEGVCVKLLQL